MTGERDGCEHTESSGIESDSTTSVRRRHLLKLASGGAVAGLSGLAGCLGDGGDGGNTTTAGGGDETTAATGGETTAASGETIAGDGEDTSTGDGDATTAGDSEGTSTDTGTVSGGTADGTASNGTASGGTPSGTTRSWPDLSGTEVHFLTDENSDVFQEFFQRVRSDFEEETGASVNLDLVNLGEQGQRLSQLLQAGDPPEVMQAVQTRVVQLQNQGVAGSVNPAMSDMQERYGEPIQDTRVQVDGTDYGVPCWLNPSGQWYRDDIYEAEPTTWDEMLTQAEQADRKQGDTRGTSIPLGPALCNDSFFLAYLYSNEGRVCARQDGQVQCIMDEGDNRDRWIETLEFLKNLYQYSPTNANAGCSQQVQAVPNETSAEAGYVGARPKVQCVQQDASFADAVRASNVPQNGTEVSHANIITYMTFEDANTEAANTFISYMFQREYFVDLLLLTPIHNNPAYQSIREDPDYQSGLDELDSAWTDEDIQTALSFADSVLGFSQETSPPNPYAGTIYSSRLLVDVMTEVTANDRDPVTVVDEYAGEVQSVIDQARG